MKANLDKELGKEQSAQVMIDLKVKEAVENCQAKFQKEKEQLEHDLTNRIQKVIKLEMELDQAKDKYLQLEGTIDKDYLNNI